MNMHQFNDTQYAQFNSLERAKLTLAACARGDEVEVNRLYETSPKYRYEAHDLEYRNIMDLFFGLESLFFQTCVKHYNSIEKTDHYIHCIMDDMEYEEERGIKDIVEQSRHLIGLTTKVRELHIAALKGLYQGLDLFCCEVGLNRDD